MGSSFRSRKKIQLMTGAIGLRRRVGRTGGDVGSDYSARTAIPTTGVDGPMQPLKGVSGLQERRKAPTGVGGLLEMGRMKPLRGVGGLRGDGMGEQPNEHEGRL